MKPTSSMYLRNADDSSTIKKHLTHFVRQTSQINKYSFGEIQFVEVGRKPTYSPFVTVSANTDPSTLWNLFTYYWKLFVPHVVVTTIGNFSSCDDHWRQTSSNAWIFTKGSSPSQCYQNEACIIAVQQAESFKNWNKLYSQTTRGLFPATYVRSGSDDVDEMLDSHHTHFVFVEGSIDDVDKFRHRLINYIGKKPIEFDSTRTKFIRIPIVVKLTEDSTEEVIYSARCAASNHIIVVQRNAKNVAALLKKMSSKQGQKLNLEQEESEEDKPTAYLSLRAILRKFHKDEDKKIVQAFFKKAQKTKVMVYPSPECPSLREAIIKSLLTTNSNFLQSATRLALIWGRVDLVSPYFSKKYLTNDSIFFSSCLHLALTLDRGEFLEILFDAGVNVYECLTVRMLWNLYYKEICLSSTQTSASSVVVHFLKKRKFELKDLLFQIGELITKSTRYECGNIYQGSAYVFTCAKHFQVQNSFERNLVVDKSALVSHPVRDLFIWCIFTEHNELAKVLWKHGHEYMAHAMFASILNSYLASYIERSSDVSRSTEHLYHNARTWEEKTINYMHISCKANEAATQSQLTSLLPHLGGSSCITLAHGGYRYSFMGTGPIQRIMDAVWRGSSRYDVSSLTILFAVLFPIIIPFINITKTKHNFSFFSNQVYRPFFSSQMSNPPKRTLKYLFRRKEQVSDQSLNVSSRDTIRNSLKRNFNKIRAFFISPKITFIGYTFFLLFTTLLMSISVITMNIYRFRITRELHFYWLLWYMLGTLAESIRLLFAARSKTFRTRLRLWFSDVWMIVEMLMLICYFSGLIIFFIAPNYNWWFASKTLFSFTLILLYVLAMKAYTVSKLLGPILQMIKRMVGDLVAFAAILVLLFWAYGIVLHSLEVDPMPTSDEVRNLDIWSGSPTNITLDLVNYVIRKPFWQIFGDLLGTATDFVTNVPEFIRASLTAIYFCFTIVLLLNLLIAMLSYTIQDVKDNSYQVWAFYRYETVQNFAHRPCLASPLNLFILIRRAIKRIRKNSVYKCEFKRTMVKQELEVSREFESEVLKKFLAKESEQDQQEVLLKNIEKSQEEMKNQISLMINNTEES